MTSQVILDQIREIELFIDVWENQGSSVPKNNQLQSKIQLQKPDEEITNDCEAQVIEEAISTCEIEEIIKSSSEKPDDLVLEEQVNKTEEKIPKDVLSEKTIPEMEIPKEGSQEETFKEEAQKQVFEERIEKSLISEEAVQESWAPKEEKVAEEEPAIREETKQIQLPEFKGYKPDEKMADGLEEQQLKRVQRKAIPNNYKASIRKDEKTLLEPSKSLHSLTSSQNMSLVIEPSMYFMKDSSISSIQPDVGIPTGGLSLRKGGEKVQTDNDSATVSLRSLSTKSFLYEQPMQQSVKPVSQSRATSISSKKSSRSIKGARRQSEKKQFQATQKYIPRSYEEMMRIPDIFERILFYEKTLDLCLKAESPITNWSQFMSTRGKPAALEEGYVPIPRSDSDLDYSSQGSMSTSFSGSISLFLKKAAGSQAFSKRSNAIDNKSFLMSSQNNSTYGSSIFGRSISRLSLSRSTQLPKYDQHKAINHRVNALNKRSPCSRRGSVRAVNPSLIKTSISTPRSFRSDITKDMYKEHSSELAYMITVLPREDTRILLDALNEANGDTMNAISIVLNKNKALPPRHAQVK